MSHSRESQGWHYMVFAGHRIDRPDRSEPRFPANRERAARREITAVVEAEITRYGAASLRAISSAANGGDILFLEICEAYAIPAEIFLPLAPDKFAAASVADAGVGWVERYEKLLSMFPVHILQDSASRGLNIWQQTNLRMLETALAESRPGITVITLWDGDEGDGAGGTKDMVDRARSAGATTVNIDPAGLK